MSFLIGKAASRFIQRFISQLDVETVSHYVNENFDMLNWIFNGEWGDHRGLQRTIMAAMRRKAARAQMEQWDVDRFMEDYLKNRNPELYAYFHENPTAMKWLRWTRQRLVEGASS